MEKKPIDLDAIVKGVALIERAVSSPLVRAALVKLLPTFGLTPEQVAQVDANHADYVDWEADALAQAARHAGQK